MKKVLLFACILALALSASAQRQVIGGGTRAAAIMPNSTHLSTGAITVLPKANATGLTWVGPSITGASANAIGAAVKPKANLDGLTVRIGPNVFGDKSASSTGTPVRVKPDVVGLTWVGPNAGGVSANATGLSVKPSAKIAGFTMRIGPSAINQSASATGTSVGVKANDMISKYGPNALTRYPWLKH